MLIHAPSYNTNLAAYGIRTDFALDRGTRVLQKLELPAVAPTPITQTDILRVHTATYLQSLAHDDTWRQIFELPSTAGAELPAILDSIKLKCGGTLLALEQSLYTGWAVNLGGGYHHAMPDAGRGFCVLNDIAIAIRALHIKHPTLRVLVVDSDFHQGDGTALIFQHDPRVFTLSIHSAEGWPQAKQASSLDVEIKSHEQHLYIPKLRQALHAACRRFEPQLVVYVAGSDPYELDQLPGSVYLKLPLNLMKLRDKTVIHMFAPHIPFAIVFGGGYGPYVWECHYWTTKILRELFHLR